MTHSGTEENRGTEWQSIAIAHLRAGRYRAAELAYEQAEKYGRWDFSCGHVKALILQDRIMQAERVALQILFKAKSQVLAVYVLYNIYDLYNLVEGHELILPKIRVPESVLKSLQKGMPEEISGYISRLELPRNPLTLPAYQLSTALERYTAACDEHRRYSYSPSAPRWKRRLRRARLRIFHIRPRIRFQEGLGYSLERDSDNRDSRRTLAWFAISAKPYIARGWILIGGMATLFTFYQGLRLIFE